MNSIKNSQTATQISVIPSTFGMPACGRVDVAFKGHMGLAVRTYAPGTSAWSPPTS